MNLKLIKQPANNAATGALPGSD